MHKGMSINKRINVLLLVCFIPLSLTALYLISLLQQFSNRYDTIVNNITTVNTYNISLKEDIDYTMYVIVANSERASELVDTDLPEERINAARTDLKELLSTTEDEYSQDQLNRILKSLNSLEDSVKDLKAHAQVIGLYDTNMERLDLDIRILTELIQEQIQEYISNEAENLEALRKDTASDVRLAIQISGAITAGALIVCLLLAHRLKVRLTDGISQLRSVTKKAGRGNFEVRASLDDYGEELSDLGEGFNHMVVRIGNLVDRIQEEQLNQRMTEQKLLQAQINPHFLYNTLDTIVWLAENGQNEEVIMMVTALSDFFRTTLSKGRDYITVKEEEAHIRSYLQIQQFRYQDILDYEISIPEEMYNYKILKLTLQPLVENALYHGIKNKRGKGHIRVTGYMSGCVMVFEVTDDGLGMTKERLEQVRTYMHKGQEEVGDPTGFGLFNVQQRIKLNYGEGYGVKISSTYMEGTQMIVEIPAKTGEGEKES